MESLQISGDIFLHTEWWYLTINQSPRTSETRLQAYNKFISNELFVPIKHGRAAGRKITASLNKLAGLQQAQRPFLNISPCHSPTLQLGPSALWLSRFDVPNMFQPNAVQQKYQTDLTEIKEPIYQVQRHRLFALVSNSKDSDALNLLFVTTRGSAITQTSLGHQWNAVFYDQNEWKSVGCLQRS